jgi:hypothetical protein
MKAVKIIGLVLFALWMAFVTFQLVQVRHYAQQACESAFEVANRDRNILDGPCR